MHDTLNLKAQNAVTERPSASKYQYYVADKYCSSEFQKRMLPLFTNLKV